MISIIIIAKQEEKSIPKLLKSIKKQNYKDYEIIVSDAHSTDKTRQIARSFGCKVINGGLPSIGRNNGAKVAKGDLLFFFDADVKLPKNFLKENIAEFRKRNLACATAIYIPLSKKFLDKLMFKFYNLWALALQYWIPYAGGFCIIVRKDVYDKVHGFNEKLILAEDHAFVKSCLKFGKFRILKSKPIFCNVRRLEKEGRISLIIKYGYDGLYRIFFGDPREAIFNYELQGNVVIEKGKRIEDQRFTKGKKKSG